MILDLLADGSLNLSTVRLLAPHLRPETFAAVVAMAKGKSKREVEMLVARLAPRADVAASVRKLPAPAQPTPAPPAPAQVGYAHSGAPRPALVPAQPDPIRDDLRGSSSAPIAAAAPEPPAHRPVVTPLAPERYRVQFTIAEGTHEKLRRVQELLRREIPDGDPGAIFDRALTLLLEDVARKKLAVTSQPRTAAAAATRSRHIPAGVRRDVWQRDGARCAFVAPNGRRCTERAFLEFHHREPHSIGGEATVANISLRCSAHNAYEAELAFGSNVPVARGLPVGYAVTGRSPAGHHPVAGRENSPRGESDGSSHLRADSGSPSARA